MTTLLDHYLELRPTRWGAKRPIIAGTRIAVSDISVHHVLHGESAEEIVDAFPHLTVSQGFAALACCFDQLPEIRSELQAEADRIVDLRGNIGRDLLAEGQNGR